MGDNLCKKHSNKKAIDGPYLITSEGDIGSDDDSD